MQLIEVLRLFDSPLSQEQCWAICYGACRTLNKKRAEDFQRHEKIKYIISFESLLLTQRGEIEILHSEPHYGIPQKDSEIIFNLGNLLCRCLDYGLNETEIEDVKFTDDMAELIGGMVLQSSEFDEGIGDLDSLSESWESKRLNTCRNFKALIEITQFCEKRRLSRNVSESKKHYLNVCKALYIEASELKAFLGHVMCDFIIDRYDSFEKSQELAKLYLQDWASLWVRVMNELRLNTAKYRAIFPEDYQYVTYEVSPLDRKIRKRNLSFLPDDAENMVYNFLRSRMTSLDSRADSVWELNQSGSLSSKEEIVDENNTKKIKLSIDKNLINKIESWNIENDISNISFQQPDKVLIYNESYFDSTTSTTNKIDHNLIVKTNEVMHSQGITFDSSFSKSLMDLDEIDLSKEDDAFTDKKIGVSMIEILKIRQELTRSEFESSSDVNFINGKKCFICRKVKFSIFQRARVCAICCKKCCLKCMVENFQIPNHLVNTLPSNLNVTYGNRNLIYSKWNLDISDFHISRCYSTDNLIMNKRKNRILLNICVVCKELLESIEQERKMKRTTYLGLDN
ncbi:protein spire homolog 1 [Hydra vulgaris]|uniref:Protein spire homolog 2 n=1 Tax=Hydra vulgaris TaxID=6087 RepID=T2M8H5_HYDVU|nr:protein spire homolog 1 [Hydra vulgaris]